MNFEIQYQKCLRHLLQRGRPKGGPQRVSTLADVGLQIECLLDDGFPILTTRKLHFSSIVKELLWFLSGSTKLEDLHRMGVHFWDQWGTVEKCERYGREPGDLGPLYGHQWRNFAATKTLGQPRSWPQSYAHDGIDQISRLIEGIRTSPESRRHLVTSWNPADLPDLWLAPCHGFFQIIVIEHELHMHHYQRSADFPVGVAFNLASYGLLLHLIAAVTGFKPTRVIHSYGDAHIYLNQVEAVKTLLTRIPRPLPQLKIKRQTDNIFDFQPDDFELIGYEPHPPIEIPVEE